MGSFRRVAGVCVRWCGGLVLALGVLAGVATPVQAQQCTSVACVSAGPRLVSLDTTQSALINPLLQALLPGTAVNLTAADWNSIAGADIELNALLTQLNGGVVVSDPSQVLNADITLAEFQAAMVQVLAADGSTADAATALGKLNLAGLTGSIRLADLLHISLPQGALSTIDLDVLDLLTGGIQLYNFRNVLTTPQPITLSTQALNDLGLASTLANVQLWVQVIEPPVYVCGPVGSEFRTSAIRIKLNTDLVQGLNLTALSGALDGLSLLGLATVDNPTVTADVLKLQLYADVARAQGTIAGINAATSVVTLNATPGLANVYVGTIADSVFFDRGHILTGADVTPTVLTNLTATVEVDTLLGINVATVRVPIAVQVRATAQGTPTPQTLTISPAFPQTRTLTCGTSCAGDLAADLLTSLDVNAVGGTPVLVVGTLPVGLPLDTVANLVTDTLEATLDTMVPTVLAPVLSALLGLVDDLLGLLGIGIGQAVFTVEGVTQSCSAALLLMKVLDPVDNPGLFNLAISQAGTVVATASNVGHNGATPQVITTAGATYDLAETAGNGTTLAPYVSTWACTDQAGNAVSSGSGTSFALTAPALSTAPVTITCRITNRARQSNLSISKTDGSGTYTPGTTATYVITVSNAGPDAVTGALINDTLPAGATLTAPWTCTATNGTCNPASGGAVDGQAVSLSVDLQASGQAQITVPVRFAPLPGAYP